MTGMKQAIVLLLLLSSSFAAELTAPQQVTAGAGFAIATRGSGEASFYLIGPVARLKRTVQLGESIDIKPQEARHAGQYLAILRSGGNTVTKDFYVSPANSKNVYFLAQPSRVPASARDAISGTAFVVDEFRNLVLEPKPVQFELALDGSAPIRRSVTTKDGLAWVRLDSSHRAGNAQFTASIGDVLVKRVVQQTAADPCNLRITARPSANGIEVQTDPVRDCSGNPVPDGTIVTFTGMDENGKSTIDSRVKRGIARAEFPAARQARISAASGVIVGNEIQWGGAR